MREEEIFFRPAVAEDAEAIATILHDMGWFKHINAESQNETTARVRHSMALGQAGDSLTILVAGSADGALVGYLAVHWLPNLMLGLEGYISELFLHADYRGQGIGRRLLEAAKAEAKKRGCERLMLFNRRSRESYQRGFYPKQGWQEREDLACFMFFLA